MIIIKKASEIEKMKQAGQSLASLFLDLEQVIKPGITTLELDTFIEQGLKERRLVSQSKGYMGYKHVSCISLNDEVVHGVPSSKRMLKDGDLVKIDICAARDGYCADMTRMFIVGTPSEQLLKFVTVARQALDKGIEQARPGNRLSDISAAVQQEVERHGYGIVRDFAGHGIGRTMHEDPEILNYGKPGKGEVLCAGMTFAIEPMIAVGNPEVFVADDDWTAKTVDKSLAAHVEDTIAITENGPIVLTRIPNDGGQG